MNAKQVFAATVATAAFSFAGLVRAQEGMQQAWPDSTKSRSEVRAELAQARKDGSINVSTYAYTEPAHSEKSRQDVRAELAQARKDGSINVSSYTYVEPAHSQKSREEVRAELAAARAHGEPLNFNMQ